MGGGVSVHTENAAGVEAPKSQSAAFVEKPTAGAKIEDAVQGSPVAESAAKSMTQVGYGTYQMTFHGTGCRGMFWRGDPANPPTRSTEKTAYGVSVDFHPMNAHLHAPDWPRTNALIKGRVIDTGRVMVELEAKTRYWLHAEEIKQPNGTWTKVSSPNGCWMPLAIQSYKFKTVEGFVPAV